jgi:hypothetical protein
MADRTYETTRAFHELLDVLRDADQKFLAGPAAVDDEVSVAEGYRWLPSILAVALDAYVWADTTRPLFTEIVGPHRKWGGDNADAFYYFAPLDPARTYRVRGTRGDAVYFSLTVYGGPRDGRYSARIVGTINDRQMTFAADGSFEIVLSATEHPGNFLRLDPDSVCAITRDYLVDPAHGRKATWSIAPTEPAPPPRLTDADMAARFRAAATFLRDQLGFQPIPYDEARLNTVDDPYPVPQTTFGWAAGDAAYAMGAFALAPDQALVIRGRSPACAFWNMCLWNPFLHTYDYRHERVTINGGQVRYEPDGSWTIVVAARDPGVPNWVSTADHPRGRIWFRWFLPQETPRPLATEVVPVADVKRAAGRSR